MSTSVTVRAAGQHDVWIVDIGTRVYRAARIGDDAWLVRNAHRRRYLPDDSPTAARVVAAVRAHLAAELEARAWFPRSGEAVITGLGTRGVVLDTYRTRNGVCAHVAYDHNNQVGAWHIWALRPVTG